MGMGVNVGLKRKTEKHGKFSATRKLSHSVCIVGKFEFYLTIFCCQELHE